MNILGTLYGTCRYQQRASLFHVAKFVRSTSTWPSHRSNKRDGPSDDKSWRKGLSLALIAGSGVAAWSLFKSRYVVQAKSADSATKGFGEFVEGLKTYTESDLSKHNSIDKRIWISYKDGVYDITDFISKHPGGNKIMMAAGGAVDSFWLLYAVHNNDKVLKLLEEYRIGNLKHDTSQRIKTEDPYSTDPKRHPALTPRSLKPFNAEPPMEILVESFYTPNDLFFVRNHLPVPVVDPKEYTLEIEGFGLKKPYVLTLDDLKNRFPKKNVSATIQCAGNRRSEMNKVEEVKGLSWGAAAISNAVWAGASLVDILQYCGLDFDDVNIKHVQFEGMDLDPAAMPYGASVPSDKALDPKSDFILAYEMNGQEIPNDHGYPVRLIAPGIVGARNVKWLGKIVLSDEESHSHWQRRDYKGFSPQVNWNNVDFDKAPAIQELPVQSAVCAPNEGEVLKREKDGRVTVKGYAYSGGGRKIVRVDVSIDNGHTWHTADLKSDREDSLKSYAWTLWELKVPVEESKEEITIVCKAVDSSYNTQPETFGPIWNLRGVLSNAWHRVKVKVQ